MKNGIILKTVLVLLVAVMLFACGGRGKKNASAGTGAETTEKKPVATMTIGLSDSLIMHRGADTLDFGRVREGETVVKDIIIRNEEDTPVVITRVDLTCGCVGTDYRKSPIKPGEEATMSVSFDSRGLGGWVYKTALIYTTQAQKPYLLVVMAEIE